MDYTKSAKNAIKEAKKVAARLGHEYVGSEHLLYGLIKEKTGVAGRVLEANGLDAATVEQTIERLLQDTGIAVVSQNIYSKSCLAILEQSKWEAKKLGAFEIGTEHIVLAMLRKADSVAIHVMVSLGANPERILADLNEVMAADVPHEQTGKQKNR